jgi:hypothetical protein
MRGEAVPEMLSLELICFLIPGFGLLPPTTDVSVSRGGR